MEAEPNDAMVSKHTCNAETVEFARDWFSVMP